MHSLGVHVDFLLALFATLSDANVWSLHGAWQGHRFGASIDALPTERHDWYARRRQECRPSETTIINLMAAMVSHGRFSSTAMNGLLMFSKTWIIAHANTPPQASVLLRVLQLLRGNPDHFPTQATQDRAVENLLRLSVHVLDLAQSLNTAERVINQVFAAVFKPTASSTRVTRSE